MGGCMLLSGCLNQDAVFADSEDVVVTHVYTGPNTPIGEFANLYLYLTGENQPGHQREPVTDPAQLPYFSQPDEAWVKAQGLKVSYDTVCGRCVCRIAPREGEKRYVLYLHGGYYVNNMMRIQYNLIKPFVEELGMGVLIPDYPLCAAYTYWDAYRMIAEVYWNLVQELGGSENILLFGDSAGGGLCLGFAQFLHGQTLPYAVLLLSPWLDVTLTNPDIALIDDPMLNRAYAQRVGVLWAGGEKETTRYEVSPVYGSLQGLPRVHVIIGGRDMLYPDVVRLRTKMREAQLPLTVYEYPQLFHDFPAVPELPESKDAYRWFVEIARGK